MALFIPTCFMMIVLFKANAQLLSLTSSPQLNYPICPGPIQFTCVGIRVPTVLQWRLNDTVHGTYVYNVGDTTPVSITLLPGVMAQVTSVSINQDSVTINITSTLSGDASALDGSSVQCTSSRLTSEIYIVDVIDITPPPSSTSCSLLLSPGGPGVSLQWNSSFNSQHAIEMYRVTVTPNLSTCSRDVTPSENYSCPELALGTQYTFTVSAINCGDQEGMEYNFTVYPQVPQNLLTVEAEPFYDSSSRLSEVRVHWRNQPLSISERCSYDRIINYTVVLVNTTGERLDQKIVRSDNCTDGLCSTSFFPSFSDQTYHVSVSATNVFGESSSTSSVTFNGSSAFNHSLSFDNCMTTLICFYLLSEGLCFIQYGQDPSYQNLTLPIQGPLNSPFTLPLMDDNTLYYYLVNNTFGIQFRGNFTTGEFAVRLTATNQLLLLVGVILLSVATIVGIVLIVVAIRTHKGSRLFLILFVVACVVVVLSIVLSVAVGFQVGLQKNACDTNWQSTRDSLIITAFVFSLLSLLYSIIITGVIFAICFKKGKVSQENVNQQEYYNVSKDITVDSIEDHAYYEEVSDTDNSMEAQSLHHKGIKTARNVVYGINDSQNPNEIKMKPNQVYGVSDLHSQEKEVRIEDKMYDVAESNKHQVSLSHDKIKMKPNMVYGVCQSSDSPEASINSQTKADLKLKKATHGTGPPGKEHKKSYVNENMEVNDESTLEYDYI